MNQPAIHNGYLVLADLSGFTSFVAGAEVEHARGILANLRGLLRSRLTPTLELAEVEGDALFLYAHAERITRGETLLELIESRYVAFRDKLRTMQRNAVCPCQACQMIPSLDLKFVTHFGQYVLQDLTGAVKPFGSFVNLAHRLLKNDVAADTGWSACALFSEAALDRIGVRPNGMHTQQASYPHLGECLIGAINLHARYAELTESRRAFLTEQEAHFTLRRSYSLPPARVWELLTDASVRNVWEIGADWSVVRRPSGRSGPGATNHCANSDFMEEVLDWRPFDYYTVGLSYGKLTVHVTGELIADGDDTDVRWSMALVSVLPRSLRGPACRFMAKRLMRAPARFDKLDSLVAEEEAARLARSV